MSRISLLDLETCTSKVRYINTTWESSGGRSNSSVQRLIILFENNLETYRLDETFHSQFEPLFNEIKPEDSITVYFPNKWQRFVSWSEKNDIYQIQSEQHTLFPITKKQIQKKSQMNAFNVLIWIYGFILVGFLVIKRLKHRNSGNDLPIE
ncbi:hypothetical protein [Marinoscillum pacificum]|uniref:hypothetical protein n=1 Tax=Marinoscillum pacificum TaxID=392723 RepID=UPI002157C24A|nr:hypothetical protein [Marinoscillum pacificum]